MKQVDTRLKNVTTVFAFSVVCLILYVLLHEFYD